MAENSDKHNSSAACLFHQNNNTGSNNNNSNAAAMIRQLQNKGTVAISSPSTTHDRSTKKTRTAEPNNNDINNNDFISKGTSENDVVPATLDALPDELLARIVSFLSSAKDLLSLAKTSKKNKAVVDSKAYIFKIGENDYFDNSYNDIMYYAKRNLPNIHTIFIQPHKYSAHGNNNQGRYPCFSFSLVSSWLKSFPNNTLKSFTFRVDGDLVGNEDSLNRIRAFRCLERHGQSLQFLSIVSHGIHDIRFVKVLTELRYLELKTPFLKFGGRQELLVQALQSNPKLESLLLENLRPSMVSMCMAYDHVLCAAAPHLQSLIKLEIIAANDVNAVTDRGLQAIATHCKRLRKLCLVGTLPRVIVGAIKDFLRHSSVQDLSISQIRAKVDPRQFVEIVQSATTVRLLHLSHISTNGSRIPVESLKGIISVNSRTAVTHDYSIDDQDWIDCGIDTNKLLQLKQKWAELQELGHEKRRLEEAFVNRGLVPPSDLWEYPEWDSS